MTVSSAPGKIWHWCKTQSHLFAIWGRKSNASWCIGKTEPQLEVVEDLASSSWVIKGYIWPPGMNSKVEESKTGMVLSSVLRDPRWTPFHLYSLRVVAMLQRRSCSRRNNVKSSLVYSSHTSWQTLARLPWLQYGFWLLGEEKRGGQAATVLNGLTYKVLHAGSEPKVQRNDVTQTGKVRCFQLEETPELLDQWEKKTVFSRG